MLKELLFVSLWLPVAFIATAQDGALTFDDALRRAMTGNPAIEAAAHGQRAAEFERKAAAGLRLPQVGVTGALVQMNDDIGVDMNGLKQPVADIVGGMGGVLPPAVLGDAAALLSSDWSLTLQERRFGFVGGNVTLPVFTGGKINAAVRAAQIAGHSAERQGEQLRGSIVSELVERYYGLAVAMRAVGVWEQVDSAMQLHLHDARALERNGVIARSERLLVEVKAGEAARDLAAAKLQVETLRSALSNTLGEDDDDMIPVSPVFIPAAVEPVSWFRETAAGASPVLRQVALARSLAQEGVRLQRSEYMPQVAVVGAMNFYRYRMSEHAPKWVVGAGVSMNIFDGLAREHRYSAARSRVARAEAMQEKAGSDIDVLIGRLYNEMTNCVDRAASLDKSIELADEYLRVQGVAFREGMATAAQLTDAELNLARARIEKLQTAYLYDVLLARLLETAGISDSFPRYASGFGIE